LIADYDGEIREGDLRDPDYLHRMLTGVDIVCHCAAWTSFCGKARVSDELFLQPSLQLIQQALEWKVKRFIFISSISAASPRQSHVSSSPGIPRSYWPHLNNIIKIENAMHDNAHRGMAMVNLRFGLFAGQRYGLGLLPILLPRLKTHLLPWIRAGKTALPIIDGKDVGQAVVRAALAPLSTPYTTLNIVGPEVPTAREVINYIAAQYHYPRPLFSLPMSLAHSYAWLIEKMYRLLPWEPPITRSIVHIFEGTDANNIEAQELIGYAPEIHWQESIARQIESMEKNQFTAMKLNRPIKPLSSDSDED
jgi:nucleoside-diphosphate-sugar epimerase